MSNPAGNPNWAWEWMGFNPPELCYNDKPIKEGYNKFKHCFDSYYGIGDFEYWKRYEIQNLSDDDKLELLHLLLEDNTKKIGIKKYLGLNPDGTINKSIDEFGEGRKIFYEKLSIEECRNNKYPHNGRCRYTHGYQCDDCGNFISAESDEYLKTEGLSNFDNSIYNFCVDFNRAKIKIPQEIADLKEQVEQLQHKKYNEITVEEINEKMDIFSKLKEKYKEVASGEDFIVQALHE